MYHMRIKIHPNGKVDHIWTVVCDNCGAPSLIQDNLPYAKARFKEEGGEFKMLDDIEYHTCASCSKEAQLAT